MEHSSPPAARQQVPSLRPLLYPTERSRLVLAVLASLAFVGIGVAILIAAKQAEALGQLIGILVILPVSIWLSVQIYRANRLGRSLRVTPETVPELHAIVEDVALKLGYNRRLEVYVADKEDRPDLDAELSGYPDHGAGRRLRREAPGRRQGEPGHIPRRAGDRSAQGSPHPPGHLGRASQRRQRTEDHGAIPDAVLPGDHVLGRPDRDGLRRRLRRDARGDTAPPRRRQAGRVIGRRRRRPPGIAGQTASPASVRPALPRRAAHHEPLRQPAVLRAQPGSRCLGAGGRPAERARGGCVRRALAPLAVFAALRARSVARRCRRRTAHAGAGEYCGHYGAGLDAGR